MYIQNLTGYNVTIATTMISLKNSGFYSSIEISSKKKFTIGYYRSLPDTYITMT